VQCDPTSNEVRTDGGGTATEAGTTLAKRLAGLVGLKCFLDRTCIKSGCSGKDTLVVSETPLSEIDDVNSSLS
jgi:hypothetical protein